MDLGTGMGMDMGKTDTLTNFGTGKQATINWHLPFPHLLVTLAFGRS